SLCISFCLLQVNVQTGSAQNKFSTRQLIKGTVINTGKEVLPHATVLLTLRDSAAVNISLTDEEGKYAFENIDLGDYLISVSMAGYETVWTDPFTILKGESFTHAPVILPEAAALSEIVIKGKKPLFELKQDRVVVNISASPAF